MRKKAVASLCVMVFGLASCAPAPPRTAASAAPAAGWYEKQFPEIARRVPHFDERMRHPGAHSRILTELTCFRPRDSRVYVPFFRYLLKDESPAIRWEAANRLRQHGVFLKEDEVPESFDITGGGRLDRKDPDCMAQFRQRLANKDDAGAGWAASGLALAKDKQSLELLGPLTDSSNVFVRHSAAMAYLELGEKEKAVKLLADLTRATDDQSGFYRQSAAEALVRLGRKQYLHVILDMAVQREGYADSGLDVLEDITGVYFASAAEWRQWLSYQGIEPPAASR